MKRLSRPRPSPALVVACLALAVALGGTSYAAVVLPAGSVGTKQLQNGAVVESKVKDHSLLARDFARGQVPPGPQGAPGTPGAHGPKGDPATNTFAVVSPAGANPALGPSSGGATVTKPGGGDGRFDVPFQQDVSNCVVVASIAAQGGNMSAG